VTIPLPFADVEPLQALKRLEVEAVLLPLLIQVVVIVLLARLLAVLVRRAGQPAVVGEIAAGLLLGPSVLGRLFPGLFQAIFHPTVHGVDPELFDQLLRWIFTGISQLGLVFLLFLVGLEFDFSHLRWHGKSALGISVCGVALPFALGLCLALLMHPLVAADKPFLGFALFMGTAMSITAIPVLARIMIDLNITRSRLGTITISAAAVNDAIGWILLATVAAVVKAEFDPWRTLLMVAETVGFGLLMAFVGRPLLRAWVRYALRRGEAEFSVNALTVVLAIVFVCAIVTNLIGIFAVFGAFILGAVLSTEREFCRAVSRRLRDFVTAFFLPIFFAYTGLRTDVGSLGASWELLGLCLLVFAAAILGKFGGCGIAARLGGFPAREATCVGLLMNTRGLMELIVINLGKDLGVIPESVFCMLVLMALLTTVMTTPLLLRAMPGTELEAYIRQTEFVKSSPEERARAAETVDSK
jgi:Kef-type K+ transport system membrane component KefB